MYPPVHIVANDIAENVTDSPTPHVGQTVCQYSRNAQQTECSKIALIQGRKVLTVTKMVGTQGDSGGPVWIPTADNKRQIIGINSGSMGLPHNRNIVSKFYLLDLS